MHCNWILEHPGPCFVPGRAARGVIWGRQPVRDAKLACRRIHRLVIDNTNNQRG